MVFGCAEKACFRRRDVVDKSVDGEQRVMFESLRGGRMVAVLTSWFVFSVGVVIAGGSAPNVSSALDPFPTSVEGLKGITTDSGLKYWDIKVGTGSSPPPNAYVIVHYSGWLDDGTLFDSSVKRNKTESFRLDQVMKGWGEGLSTMKPGGIRRLEIPSKIALGEKGRPPLIPENADLIFEVQLIEIRPLPTLGDVSKLKLVELSRGVKKWTLKQGKGKSPNHASKVNAHYSLWLSDGTFLDSTLLRKKPEEFIVTDITEGLRRGIVTMKEGGRCRFEVPYLVAYGEAGRLPRIPPKADLIYEIELIEVVTTPHVVQQASVDGIKPIADGSGLKYWDMKVGEGRSPTDGSKVKVHYSGWLADGYLFDSSVQRNEPMSLEMVDVIPGWRLGLMTMKEGGFRRLEIPPVLAYGDEGKLPSVPPGAKLTYDIQLIQVID